MKQITLSLLMTMMISGCVLVVDKHGHLYPVEGPAAAQSPPHIYTVTMNVVMLVGTLSATLPDGEVCHGNMAKLDATDPASRNMQADWDRVYGDGFFTANLLGKERGRANLTGASGPCLQIEMYNPLMYHGGGLTDVVGVARDDQGNLYKLTF
jgi:hypothetical protein